jgi:hypothetical protein
MDRLRGPCLQMLARPSAVPCARHFAKQLLWARGLKELTDQVELVVSEIVTNAVRVSGGLDKLAVPTQTSHWSSACGWRPNRPAFWRSSGTLAH